MHSPVLPAVWGGEGRTKCTGYSVKQIPRCLSALFPQNSLIAVFLRGDRETEPPEKCPQNQALRAAALTYQPAHGGADYEAAVLLLTLIL